MLEQNIHNVELTVYGAGSVNYEVGSNEPKIRVITSMDEEPDYTRPFPQAGGIKYWIWGVQFC